MDPLEQILTSRQYTVFDRAFGLKLSNPEIAAALGIDIGTVVKHLQNGYARIANEDGWPRIPALFWSSLYKLGLTELDSDNPGDHKRVAVASSWLNLTGRSTHPFQFNDAITLMLRQVDDSIKSSAENDESLLMVYLAVSFMDAWPNILEGHLKKWVHEVPKLSLILLQNQPLYLEHHVPFGSRIVPYAEIFKGKIEDSLRRYEAELARAKSRIIHVTYSSNPARHGMVIIRGENFGREADAYISQVSWTDSEMTVAGNKFWYHSTRQADGPQGINPFLHDVTGIMESPSSIINPQGTGLDWRSLLRPF